MRKKEYDVVKVPTQLSASAYNFFTMKKGHKEPIYSVVDRWIDASLKKIEDWQEQTEKQAKVISIYYDRMKAAEKRVEELEAMLGSPRQLKLDYIK